MTTISAVQSMTAAAIDAAMMAREPSGDDLSLRCSSLGTECDRLVWYRYRWAMAGKAFPARILRIFDNGHDREARIVSYLREAGIVVTDRNLNGDQIETAISGFLLTGHVDGIAERVPEAPKTKHLLEIKTMNSKRWNTWRAKGVRVSDPKYFVQIQLYMHGLHLTRCLFVCENQDTKEIEAERIDYDMAFATAQIARAERIASSDRPPARMNDNPSWWQCKTCEAWSICHGGEMPRRNCRTCLASRVNPQTQAWDCARHGKALLPSDQKSGCATHLFGLDLLPFEQIDADHDAMTVTYRKPDGSTWIDGVQAS